MKKISVVVAVCFAVMNFSGNLLADEFEVTEDFSVPPVHLTVKLDDGSTLALAIAGVREKQTKKAGIGTSFAGPNKACSGTPQDYATKVSNLAGTVAKFEGDPHQPGELDGEFWLYKSKPGAIYYRNSDGSWGHLAAALIYPDPRKSPNDTRLKLLVFKPKRVEEIDGKDYVVVGNISEAILNRIPTEKPTFIGDLSELTKLTANAQRNGAGGHTSSSVRQAPAK